MIERAVWGPPNRPRRSKLRRPIALCDYCDEQNGDAWQMSAAIVAAAYARAVLERVRASEMPDQGGRRRDKPRDEFSDDVPLFNIPPG